MRPSSDGSVWARRLLGVLVPVITDVGAMAVAVNRDGDGAAALGMVHVAPANGTTRTPTNAARSHLRGLI
ncbi:hypothetical protein Cs7R123_65470 [Catellatospora sp. TT07R-123]|nr:hypothetical protein Cs7R123_65470 [Catellatospora sp. TT07R-123]